MSPPEPPRLARRLLESALPEDQRDDVLGDLDEVFQTRCRERGPFRARAWYVRESLAFAARFGLQRMREAQRAVRREFGDIDGVKEAARDAWGGLWFERLAQDTKLALRVLRRSPGLALVFILILGVGLGANAAVFSVVNGVFWKKLPVSSPDRLVDIALTDDGEESAFSWDEYREYQSNSVSFSGLAASSQAYLADRDDARELDGAVVSGNFFEVLEVRPAFGRLLMPADDEVPGRDPVVVLGHRFWRERYGGDSAVVGTTAQLNDVAFTVVGVMGPDFRALRYGDPEVDAWIPSSAIQVANPAERSGLRLLGRLSPDASIEEARAESLVFASRLDALQDSVAEARSIVLSDLTGAPRIDERLPRLLLIGVMSLLAVACANLAGLLIARGLSRRKEIATRLALGAGRSRILRQIVTETSLLTIVGVGLGVFMARLLIIPLGNYYAAEVEGVRPYFDFGIDGVVLAYAAVISIVIALILGLVPALQATRGNNLASLKKGRVQGGYRRSNVRVGLLVTQVGLSVALLVCAGLMLQSFRTVLVTPGIDADRVAFIRMKTNLAGYPREQSAAYFREVIARVEGIAGVQSVSMVQLPPVLAWQFGCGYRFTSGEADSQGQELCALFNMVSTNFFETVGAPIISGRSFQDADLAGQPAVAVVSETFARRLWAGRNAVGSSLIFNGRNYEVIGVASYLDYARADGSERPFVFFPSGQPGNRMLVRVEGDAAGLLPLIRQEVSRADPNVPISEELTLAEVVESMFMPVKLATTTLGYAGVLALLLSVIGLYGVLSDSVQQRRAEIGIRMAIGARPGDVRNQVMYEALRLVIGGVALGLPGAYAASRLLTSYLYGVAQFDLLSFSVAPTILVAVALAATYVPAKRAAAANPLDSLRCD